MEGWNLETKADFQRLTAHPTTVVKYTRRIKSWVALPRNLPRKRGTRRHAWGLSQTTILHIVVPKFHREKNAVSSVCLIDKDLDRCRNRCGCSDSSLDPDPELSTVCVQGGDCPGHSCDLSRHHAFHRSDSQILSWLKR